MQNFMDENTEHSTTFQNYCLKRQKLKCVTLFWWGWPEPQPFTHFVHFGQQPFPSGTQGVRAIRFAQEPMEIFKFFTAIWPILLILRISTGQRFRKERSVQDICMG